MERIKIGTDGWRGIIANQFTVDNVARITHAAALWLLKKYENPAPFAGTHDASGHTGRTNKTIENRRCQCNSIR